MARIGAIQGYRAEPAVAADGAGITAFRGILSLRPAPLLNCIVHHAHQHQVVHRDLKPSNVLFQGDGAAKITDFGLAKQLDSDIDLTSTGRILGTVRYMAPEQATGEIHAIGPATDIHALGVIFYELLTGRHAFDGRTLLAALEQIRSREPVPPKLLRPEVPAELEGICLRCLQKDPTQRYGTAEELATRLQTLQGRSPSETAPPSSLVEPAPNEGDRSRWWRI